MNFNQWLEYGYNHNWCSPPICEIHDGTPLSESESVEFENGFDPCIHIIRLYNDIEMKSAVETYSSFLDWRASSFNLKQ